MSKNRRNRRDFLRSLAASGEVGLPPISPSLANAMRVQAAAAQPQPQPQQPQLAVTSDDGSVSGTPIVYLIVPVGGNQAVRAGFTIAEPLDQLIAALTAHREKVWPRLAASEPEPVELDRLADDGAPPPPPALPNP